MCSTLCCLCDSVTHQLPLIFTVNVFPASCSQVCCSSCVPGFCPLGHWYDIQEACQVVFCFLMTYSPYFLCHIWGNFIYYLSWSMLLSMCGESGIVVDTEGTELLLSCFVPLYCFLRVSPMSIHLVSSRSNNIYCIFLSHSQALNYFGGVS